MKSSESTPETFREGVLNKKSVLIAIEVAIGLLLTALVVKYGKSVSQELQKKIVHLLELKQELQTSIETDDVGSSPNSETASQKAMMMNHAYLELADHAEVNWGHTAVQVVTLLPELLRHRGPKDG